MNGVVMKKLGLRGKLLLAQLVVLFVSCLAIAAVAIAVAAPLFHNHLMMAGIEDSNVRTHTEEAFAQTMTIALLCGIAVALVGAGIAAVLHRPTHHGPDHNARGGGAKRRRRELRRDYRQV